MQVRELMIANPWGIQANGSVRHAAELMRRHGIGAVVVYEQDRPAGMLTDRDIAINCIGGGHDNGDCPAREHMTADPVTIDADADLTEALRMMGSEQVRRLLVTSHGQVAGIIALGDLAVRSPHHAEVARALAEISQPVRQPAYA